MSNNLPPPGHCFTTTCRGLSRVLVNEVGVESAINPSGKKSFKVLWDTGASLSLVWPEVAAQLDMKPVSKTKISTPTSKDADSNLYLVNLYLPNQVRVLKVLVAEGIPGGTDMFIGMDIIGLGDFAVSNYNNTTVVSFRMPSMDTIDFCKSSHIMPARRKPTVGRNDLCPCGSGKKYKMCCGR
ncbi:MAG: SEC-C domain-containing protein [Treponematales bacterium]